MSITNSPKDSWEITIRKVLIMTTLAITNSMLFLLMKKIKITAWKVSVFGVVLVPIFPHLDWISPNTDTFYAVNDREVIHPSKENVTRNSNQHILDKKKDSKEKLLVNVTFCDTLVKDVKEWKLSDKNSKIVRKHYSGAVTNDMNRMYNRQYRKLQNRKLENKNMLVSGTA